nr:uncharacterized protein LOC115263797 [Aedes albopictus]
MYKQCKYESLLNKMTDKKSTAEEKLLNNIAGLAARNASNLQASLTSKLLKQPEEPLKDVRGNFLNPGSIRQLSIAVDSDYLCIKFVRFRRVSVTERRSNNPFDRSKPPKSADGTSGGITLIRPSGVSANTSADATGEPTKRLLEKEKVDFVFACLCRRRIFLQDDPYAAQEEIAVVRERVRT